MKGMAAVVTTLALLSTAGTAMGQDSVLPALPQNPLEGARVFQAKGCGRCHAIWGFGGTLGPDLTARGQGWSAIEFAGVLWNHSPKMIETMRQKGIPRPELTSEEMAALSAYLYYLNFFDNPGDAARGEKLISSKRCIRCHSIGGRGAEVGPALDKFGLYVSPVFIATEMWNHGIKMAAKMGEREVTRPELSETDIADLLAYINKAAKKEVGHPVYMLAGRPTRGAELFRQKKCVTCHAVRGKGGSVGPDLAKEDLPKKASAVAAVMWNHAPKMWPKMRERKISLPTFENNEMADVIAYLSFLAYSDQPGDGVRGQKVVRSKGCLGCHSIRGRGNDGAPDLATSKEIGSPVALVTAIWNHAPKMGKAFQEKGVPWPYFGGTEMADLVAYLEGIREEPRKVK